MAETSETPEEARDFAQRYIGTLPDVFLWIQHESGRDDDGTDSGQAVDILESLVDERDSAIASAARREERARLVKRLRDEAEQYAEIDRARDWYNMAADLIESEAT